MRYLYIVLLAGLLPRLAAAQAEEVADSARAAEAPQPAPEYWAQSLVDSTGECTEVMRWGDGQRGLVRVFHPSGQLKQYLPYADLAAGQLHGVVTSWYDNGQLAARQTFLRGQREGELLVYYASGQLKRQTQYEAGNERLGTCFDEAGNPLAYFPYEQPPLYPGGQLQLIKEIKSALRNWRPTGPVQLSRVQLHVRLLVTAQGRVANAQVTVTVSNTKLNLTMLPKANDNPAAWQKMAEQVVAPLVGRAQGAIAQLSKSFYPGQLDGVTTNWQYSFTIPLEYESWQSPVGSISRHGANFGL